MSNLAFESTAPPAPQRAALPSRAADLSTAYARLAMTYNPDLSDAEAYLIGRKIVEPLPSASRGNASRYLRPRRYIAACPSGSAAAIRLMDSASASAMARHYDCNTPPSPRAAVAITFD